jgi:SAM-dependent methyltransferase
MDAEGPPPPDATYLLPRHPSEVDRLDLQHYALRAMINADHLAPVDGAIAILDLGCGTGQWAFELCKEVPAALVVGLDLVPSKPNPPENYGFVRASVLQSLPFGAGSFDLVHQRFMSTAVPVSSWADGLGEVVRVTRPGGWVELGEPAGRFEPAGPATAAVRDMFRAFGASLGLDMDGVLFDSLDDGLRRAGLVEVQRRNIDLPIGEWGGRIGSLMATDLRAIAMRMAPVLQAQFDLPREKWHEMLIAMQQEWVENHSTFPFAIAFGRKPR